LHSQLLAKAGGAGKGIEIGGLIRFIRHTDLIGVIAQFFERYVLHGLTTTQIQGQKGAAQRHEPCHKR